MKTKIYNLIVTAAISILTLTADAQNTKSYNVALNNDRLFASTEKKNTVLIMKEELDNQISKLSEYIKFTPKTSSTEYSETAETDYWTNLLAELTTQVKYRPNAYLIMKYEQEKLVEEITMELKPVVKFNPKETSLMMEEDKFSEILKELEAEVKYKPTVIP